MAELSFDAGADRTLDLLEADPTRAILGRRVLAFLVQLQVDPGDNSVRRLRFQTEPVCGVPVFGDGEEWVVLCERDPEVVDHVIVRYIGPASFA